MRQLASLYRLLYNFNNITRLLDIYFFLSTSFLNLINFLRYRLIAKIALCHRIGAYKYSIKLITFYHRHTRCCSDLNNYEIGKKKKQ